MTDSPHPLGRRFLVLSVGAAAVIPLDSMAQARGKPGGAKTPSDRDPLDAPSISRERRRAGHTGITDTDPGDAPNFGRTNDRDPTDPQNRGRRGRAGPTDSDPTDPPGMGHSGR